MNVNTMHIFALVLTMVSCSVGETSCGDYFRKSSSIKLKESYHTFLKKSIDTCIVQSPCAVSIPDKSVSLKCKIQRVKSISLNRQYYRLRHVPFLNQTMEAVSYHTALDPVNSFWITTFTTFSKTMKIIKSLQKPKDLNDISRYKVAYHQHNQFIQSLRTPQYFANPTMEKTFTDIFTDDRWMSDEVFVQQRLAGTCPFLLRKVTVSGMVGMRWNVLKKQLNKLFDFDQAIQSALGIQTTLEEVVKEGFLYVLYHEGYNDMESQPDKDAEKYESLPRKMVKATSPITLFVRTSSGKLKVVSIQWDYKPESPVYTPKSDYVSWMLAKSMVNLVDSNNCQYVWHLSHLHFSSTVYCTTFRRHFSELHPMYQIMQYHCVGTTPHISLSWHTLALPNQIGDKMETIGYEGILKLVQQGIYSYRYGLLAHEELLERRGLYSDEIKYYPFRDDGKLIWDEFQRFACNFVNTYYKADGDVKQDMELRSFTNEVSIDGKIPPDGGKGKIVGFPPAFHKKKELTLFLTRFIWHVAFHASVNYALEPWMTFVPLSPTKLYDDKNLRPTDNIAYLFPRYESFEASLGLSEFLGNFRMNRIMDHYDKIHDKTLSKLVEDHYHQLHQCVQKKLESRNALRKSKNQMGYQYFEPKWLTNSIHI